jgi:hypothetical protein
MEQRNGQFLAVVENVVPAEIASLLGAAQDRVRKQRVAIESLLGEARELEGRLAAEALQARGVAERQLAKERAAAAAAALQLEREAIIAVEACAKNSAALTAQRDAVEIASEKARTERDAAQKIVADYEARAKEARAAIAQAIQAGTDAEGQRAELIVAQARLDADTELATQHLAVQRAARQYAENLSSEQHARALGLPNDTDLVPTLEHVEELRLMEARIGLRADTAKRAAERRASDTARGGDLVVG